MDVFAASRAAEWTGIDITAFGRAGTVALRNTISTETGRHANCKTHGDTHAGSNTNTDANINPDSSTNPDANSCTPDLQPRLRDRDGERGVAQHYW